MFPLHRRTADRAEAEGVEAIVTGKSFCSKYYRQNKVCLTASGS
uniref:Uncharacterized protein n=1 Tax=Anguilla anguilla TaxID=7936 RepID=A0A0E9QQS4_ANGAN